MIRHSMRISTKDERSSSAEKSRSSPPPFSNSRLIVSRYGCRISRQAEGHRNAGKGVVRGDPSDRKGWFASKQTEQTNSCPALGNWFYYYRSFWQSDYRFLPWWMTDGRFFLQFSEPNSYATNSYAFSPRRGSIWHDSLSLPFFFFFPQTERSFVMVEKNLEK